MYFNFTFYLNFLNLFLKTTPDMTGVLFIREYRDLQFYKNFILSGQIDLKKMISQRSMSIESIRK